MRALCRSAVALLCWHIGSRARLQVGIGEKEQRADEACKDCRCCGAGWVMLDTARLLRYACFQNSYPPLGSGRELGRSAAKSGIKAGDGTQSGDKDCDATFHGIDWLCIS